MTRWAYKAVIVDHKSEMTLTEHMNKLGEEGWEAFHVSNPSLGQWIAFLKRPDRVDPVYGART